ncbi:MAG: hypothetical protein H7Z14_21960 [Anaerolineae bacterium]|nr:hypothetical protein [Phycisphaerae bacterium]
MPPTPTTVKPLSKRALAAKQAAQEMKLKKLHVIASRRAKAQGMEKEAFIAAIVKGDFRPITADDIAAEPDVEAEAEAPAAVEAKTDEVPVEASQV